MRLGDHYVNGGRCHLYRIGDAETCRLLSLSHLPYAVGTARILSGTLTRKSRSVE